MRLFRSILCCLVVVLTVGIMPCILKAEAFKIAILQNGSFSVQRYEPLVAHLAKAGISVKLVEAPSYQAISRMMSAGEVDAMFNGPGIPGSMMMIHQLKQYRLLASFKKAEGNARPLMPSQNRIN
jgi:ABC-type phosphate/phosphonate transport system substrate-binding protein